MLGGGGKGAVERKEGKREVRERGERGRREGERKARGQRGWGRGKVRGIEGKWDRGN